MLWTVLLIVLLMWALGFGFSVGGSLIHILLVVACGLGPRSFSGPQSRVARMNRFGPSQSARTRRGRHVDLDTRQRCQPCDTLCNRKTG